MEGSSRTYNTPVKPEPICDANLIRCASPPESVAAPRCSVRYSRPTSTRNCSRSRISRKIILEISCSLGEILLGKLEINNNAFSIAILETSIIDLSKSVMEIASFFSRPPLQSGQTSKRINLSICVLINCDSDSLYFCFNSQATPRKDSSITVSRPNRFSPSTRYFFPPVPKRSKCFCSSDNSPIRLVIGILFSSQKVLNVRENHVSLVPILKKGTTPPSLIVKLSFKIKSGSAFKTRPNPAQVGQAPCGVLKEKMRGSISGREILSIGQANFSEN